MSLKTKCAGAVMLMGILTGCKQADFSKSGTPDAELSANLKVLEKSRVYFGHQSVGKNIMAGVLDLIKASGAAAPRVMEMDPPMDLPEYYFLHARIGRNEAPDSKCHAFTGVLAKLAADTAHPVEAAALKFCYVDITAKSDPKAVFATYHGMMDTLKRVFPQVAFVHVTVPLSANSGGWKLALKRAIGKEDWADADNIKRNQYNDLLRETYKGEPVFDLAAIESTYPDGTREEWTKDGKTYYSLIHAYTHDGGHLNELGRKVAAKELIRVMAQAAQSRQTRFALGAATR
jgi:hypothetical protein